MNILLALTGSVATIKYEKLISKIKESNNVKVIATQSASHFISNKSEIIFDQDEWKWNKIGDLILHIDLKDWADKLLFAPLSANTLAKISHGICDNLVTCVYRAYPVNKPIIIAPAMNTDMWNHPLTNQHLSILKNRHSDFKIINPINKNLACGITGIGAMADINDIVKELI